MGDGRRALVHGACVALVILLASTAIAVEPCPAERACAEIAVDGPDAPIPTGGTASVAISLDQAPADANAGGPDEIAALVLTLAIPGLELADCDAPNADGLTAAFTLSPALADSRVIGGNTTCARRTSCLCPDAGQPRDEFVDILVAGPRVLRPGVPFPPLPSGELLSIALRVTPRTEAITRLHLFNGADDAAAPAGGALLSVADVSAVDVTTDRDTDTSNVRVLDGELFTANPPLTPSATLTATPVDTPTVPSMCVGDCNGGRTVTVDELIVGVSIALGALPLERCPAVNCNGDGTVTVACLIAAVNAALSGCS
jgi:hypothetical protein